MSSLQKVEFKIKTTILIEFNTGLRTTNSTTVTTQPLNYKIELVQKIRGQY